MVWWNAWNNGIFPVPSRGLCSRPGMGPMLFRWFFFSSLLLWACGVTADVKGHLLFLSWTLFYLWRFSGVCWVIFFNRDLFYKSFLILKLSQFFRWFLKSHRNTFFVLLFMSPFHYSILFLGILNLQGWVCIKSLGIEMAEMI